MSQLLPIDIPPGVYRRGTEYQSKGRWWDASLTRWRGVQAGPIGGWRARTSSAVTGKARAILPWRDNSGNRWIGIGTASKLYIQNASGTNFDITPSAFTSGNGDETANIGFGVGLYGSGAYNTPRPDTGSVTPAMVWDLDLWGDELVGCAFSDGRLVQWALNTGTPAAAISGAPTGCLGTCVAEQGFQFAFTRRGVQWSDQGDNTDWTPSSTNQAGQIDLATFGTFQKGARLGPLIFALTDQDAHVGQYVGLPEVWRFQRVGAGCGAISRGCVIGLGSRAVWWSKSGFWLYDGSVSPVECDVYEYLQDNLNPGQRSKITGFHNSEFGEAWWFYPSTATNECDSYVYWNYRQNHWNIGALARTCGAQAGVFSYPLAIDPSGYTYEHEVGLDFNGDGPFVESGPLELGDGDRVMRCVGIIPDEGSVGSVTVSFSTRPFPNAAETVLSETSLNSSGYADQRWAAREARMKVTGVDLQDWRWGKARLDVSPGGRR